MAFLASKSALEDAGWLPTKDSDKERTGVVMGSTKSHVSPAIHFINQVLKEGPRTITGEFNKHLNVFGTALNVVSHYDLRGPNSGSSSACAAGQYSIAEAFNTIKDDEADVMVAGNTDIGIHPYVIGGLSRLGALNKKNNETPELASRPFDEQREGFVAADGSGVLILEELNHAVNRGASIYGELLSVGLCTESYHPTRPHLEGDGIYRTMLTALQRANVSPDQIDLIHAHGTSTFEGDKAEAFAISKLFKDPGPCIMGIKSNMGHMMSGVGGIQAATVLLTIKYGLVPPILNLENPLTINGRKLDFVTKLREKKINYAITNNAGFGGLNSTLLFKRYD